MLSHSRNNYPVYDFYSRGIIGVIVDSHVINIYIYIITKIYYYINNKQQGFGSILDI